MAVRPQHELELLREAREFEHHLVQNIHGWHAIHSGWVGQINRRLAVTVTRAVGTMWAAYLFCLIALVSFPQAVAAFVSGDRVTGISWLSQSFIQLVLLPVILVGQRVLAATQDEQAKADHDLLVIMHRLDVTNMEILHRLEDLEEVRYADREREDHLPLREGGGAPESPGLTAGERTPLDSHRTRRGSRQIRGGAPGLGFIPEGGGQAPGGGPPAG